MKTRRKSIERGINKIWAMRNAKNQLIEKLWNMIEDELGSDFVKVHRGNQLTKLPRSWVNT